MSDSKTVMSADAQPGIPVTHDFNANFTVSLTNPQYKRHTDPNARLVSG